MRDLERIDRMLNLIRELWNEVPDWRLGQIIFNAARRKEECPSVYSIEDDEMEVHLSDLLKRYRDDPK